MLWIHSSRLCVGTQTVINEHLYGASQGWELEMENRVFRTGRRTLARLLSTVGIQASEEGFDKSRADHLIEQQTW